MFVNVRRPLANLAPRLWADVACGAFDRSWRRGAATFRPRAVLPLLTALVRGQRLPYSLTLVLTNRCNAACEACDIRLAGGPELPTAAWRDLLTAAAQLGLGRASFSGGEALLRPDLAVLLAHAKSLGLLTSLNTNAYLLASRFAEIAPHLDMLVVSLDGPAALHDRRRGLPGGHARTLAALADARARGIRAASITVLDGETRGVVPDVLAWAREIGFSAYFQPRQSSCFDAAAGLTPGLEPAALAAVAAELTIARRRGAPVGASAAYLARLSRGGPSGGCSGCRAGRYFASVLPDGRLVPCHLTAKARAYPNAAALGFAAAWQALEGPLSGPGCLIAPYQEMDALFHFDPSAVWAALRRLA